MKISFWKLAGGVLRSIDKCCMSAIHKLFNDINQFLKTIIYLFSPFLNHLR